MKNSIALVLASTLLATACGKSSSDDNDQAPPAPASNNPLVPADFQNTTSAEDFQKRNEDVKAMMLRIDQQFGVKVQSRDQKTGAQVLTQSVLQAFVGSKADSTILSRSLEVEGSITLITRLLSDKPSSCNTAVASLDALYTSLTASASEAIAHTDYAQLEKTAKEKGLTLEEQPKTADTALAFRLTGSLETPGQKWDQQLDFSAGANDQMLFVKRDSQLVGVLTRGGKDGEPVEEWGHSNFVATSGLTADLVKESVVLIDQRQADFDMLRNGHGISGSSRFNLLNTVQGGALPAVTSEVVLDLKGDGLDEEEGNTPLYNEHRAFSSKLVKVDENTLTFNLNMASEGVKGSKQLAVEWKLQKNAQGQCSVTRVGS